MQSALEKDEAGIWAEIYPVVCPANTVYEQLLTEQQDFSWDRSVVLKKYFMCVQAAT